MSYEDFIMSKTHEGEDSGFDPVFLPGKLKDFQRSMVEWSVRKGRAALFEDCGLGKTYQSLVWAQNIHLHTGKPVLMLTPLAVSAQTVAEADKFGIEAARSVNGEIEAPIVVTNYQRLNKFNPEDFSGVVLDESSILKNFNGATRQEITGFMRKMPYRLLCTATAAPNDWIELGTSSEALGYMGFMDMLGKFFVNNNNNTALRRMYGEAPQYRLKGHAETPFWKWVCSWARALRKPSDLGFSDGGYNLPPLREHRHLVSAAFRPEGMLFEMAATNLIDQRQELRATIGERCEKAAELATHDRPCIVWCHLNDEADTLERSIPCAVQVSGSMSDDEKEERLTAFATGEARVLVTKPKIGAWGLNFQHCSDVVYFPSHSYEQYYQSVRRCWRFGQRNPVDVHLIHTEGQSRVFENLQRKSEIACEMFDQLVRYMNDAMDVTIDRSHETTMEVPTWL